MGKEYLTLKETAEFMDLSESYIYRLTHLKQIPFSKPWGKKIYFKVSDLNEFLGRNKVEVKEQQNEIIK